MSVEENTEAPNWLAKLEEQREKRLRARLGHEAGAGAPCQNCGDKCPGLDLHFWRKICKLCKCVKEEHDVSDDDIHGFVQFQLLGNRPSKAKSIFLSGKKDAVTLEWTPAGSNTDVKKYLEQLPEDELPVKGSEAARVRKQRLQKQMPAHDIDATLCHALSPAEVQQLEEYVAHIRAHSVGQGRIVQLPVSRGQPHRLPEPNAQLLSQHVPGQVASSQPVSLHASALSGGLQRPQPANARQAFLNSQLPQLSALEETAAETVTPYRPPLPKPQHNYAPHNIHQYVDNQEPRPAPHTTDINYPVSHGVTNPLFDNPALLQALDKINLQDPVQSEHYYSQNPNYAGKVPQKIGKSTTSNPLAKDKYQHQNFLENPSCLEENKFKMLNPNSHVIHSAHNVPLKTHSSELLSGKNSNQHFRPIQEHYDNASNHTQAQMEAGNELDHLGNKSHNIPQYERGIGQSNYLKHDNTDKQGNIPSAHGYDMPNKFTDKHFGGPNEKVGSNANLYGKPSGYGSHPYNPNPVMRNDNTNECGHVPGANYGSDIPQSRDNIEKTDYLGNCESQDAGLLPLTTSNVERHQEQFSEAAYKDRLPIPVYSAENKLNPLESEQQLSSVGYIRDVEYGVGEGVGKTAAVLKEAACHRCKRALEEGELAVSVERTGALWHAACFTCRTCQQPLADLLYLFHRETDDIYCGRDYALLKGFPRCAACDELIFVREYCLAEERTFHVKHFCCFECDEPLAGRQYVMEAGQPTCTGCYEQFKAQRCTDCGYAIGPEEPGVSLQQLHWHAADTCFACKHCRRPLLNAKLLLRNRNLFCSDICFKTYHAITHVPS